MFAFDSEKFVNREQELKLVKEKISQLVKRRPFAPHERVVHFVGPSGIGKSYLLAKCYTEFDAEPSCVPILIRLETLGNRNKEFIDEFLAAVYGTFCTYKSILTGKYDGKTRNQFVSHVHRTINVHGKDQVIALLLDEINVPQKKDIQDIEEYLLEELIHDNERAVLITAGRSHPMLNDFALRPTSTNTFLLRAFDQKTTGEQLEVLMPGSANLAEKFVELGSGVPGNNTKLVRHVIGKPPEIVDELQAVRSLLADVKGEIEERFLPILDAICILKGFYPEDSVPLLREHPALGTGWDEIRIKAVFPELKQVQIGPGGLINWDKDNKNWVMDEPTRALFEREIKMRDLDLWRKLHCTAYQMYKQWGDEFNSRPYKDKAVYHQTCLQSAGMDCDDLGKEG